VEQYSQVGLAQLQDITDVFGRNVLDVPEHQHLALALGQLIDGVANDFERLERLKQRGRIDERPRHRRLGPQADLAAPGVHSADPAAPSVAAGATNDCRASWPTSFGLAERGC
jgi:hypothetical protein